jgi:hypothetical protein
MTTTSTDTIIFIASWLEPRPPPAVAASFPDGAGDDDGVPMTTSRRWPARPRGGHAMYVLLRSGRRGFSGDCSLEKGKEEKDVRMQRNGVGVSEAMVAAAC